VVRTPGGEVLLDPTGRAPGRGAYVHPVGGCIERASRGGFIGRALRRALGPAEAGRLIDELRVYLEEST